MRNWFPKNNQVGNMRTLREHSLFIWHLPYSDTPESGMTNSSESLFIHFLR